MYADYHSPMLGAGNSECPAHAIIYVSMLGSVQGLVSVVSYCSNERNLSGCLNIQYIQYIYINTFHTHISYFSPCTEPCRYRLT